MKRREFIAVLGGAAVASSVLKHCPSPAVCSFSRWRRGMRFPRYIIGASLPTPVG